MPYNPGVSFFIPFDELDPSNEKQCIYYTQKGARCRCSCQESDNKRAAALQKEIISMPCEAVSLDLLEEYVLCNCCRSGRARHRDRIEDEGLLKPLALRWQDEIRRHAADLTSHTTSVPALNESVLSQYACTNRATSTPSHTRICYTTTASPSHYQPKTGMSLNVSAAFSKPDVSSSSNQDSSPRSSTATELAFQPSGSHETRYDFRPRQANGPTNSTSIQSPSISQVPRSDFRPHIAEPLPSDSVYRKILDPLKNRDFETGSLYIFDRDSSPGHVKIGWTAKSVSRRLKDWSKCGYKPNLLFSMNCVPHAQRVETLTHHELIKEWRRERMCKAQWCRKSHQEWFEISKKKAEQVLCNWADFIRKAEPYNPEGLLKNQWKKVIEKIECNGEVVTAKKLLSHYEASLAGETTVVVGHVDLGYAPRVLEVNTRRGPEARRLKLSKEDFVCLDSYRIEQPTLPKETALLKNEASPKQIPLREIPPPNALKMSKSDSVFKWKPLPKTEPVYEGVLALETTPVKKELLPEQTPLPLSPLLQSTITLKT